jgi:hypothetical protein
VMNRTDAADLVIKLEQAFEGCRFNFDIDDCDHILRVQVANGIPDIHGIINLLIAEGFKANVLPDDIPVENTAISFQPYEHNRNLQAFVKR